MKLKYNYNIYIYKFVWYNLGYYINIVIVFRMNGETMKIKEGFVLKDIVGTAVVLPTGQRVVEFQYMMALNESGCILWSKLQNEVEIDDLVQTLVEEYAIDKDMALKDVEEFVDLLNQRGILNDLIND